MTTGGFWNGGFGLGVELGAAPGLLIAILAMSIIRRKTKDQPFAAYGRSVQRFCMVLVLILAAMAGGLSWFLGSHYGASSSLRLLMGLTGSLVGFGISSCLAIFLLILFESIGELRRQLSKRGRRAQS
jgi:hypothetical protein